MNIAGFVRRRPLLSFFALVFGVSWSLGIVLYVILQMTQTPARVTEAPPLALLVMFLAEAFASLAGVFMTLSVGGRQGMHELFRRLRQWRIGVHWYAVAILTTPIAASLALIVLTAIRGPNFLPAVLQTQQPAPLIVFSLFFGLMTGLLEEFGWTGFALPRLLDRYPAFKAAFALGVVWALWHALLVLWVWPAVPSPNLLLQLGGGMVWMAALVPYRILMSWVYINTRSSLLIGGIIMHAFYDASLAMLVPTTLSPVELVSFYGGLTVILSIFVLAAVAVSGATRLTRAKPEFQSTMLSQGVGGARN